MRDFTDITIILDRSGSMHGTENDVIGGINNFIKDQKELGDNASLTLVQFDTEYQVDYNNVPINEVKLMTEEDYSPRGGTALNDAIGRTINEVGARLRKMYANERPDKVLFIIYTDGWENSSREFSGKQVKVMVEHQTNAYNWDFTYLGANQDAVLKGGELGIKGGKSLSYSDVGQGKFAALASVSRYTKNARGGAVSMSDNTYSSEDRATQNELIDKHGK